MDNTYDLRNVPSSDIQDKNGKEQWPLYKLKNNTNAYKLYYYLLSISAIDNNTHRYYVTKSRRFKQQEAADVIGCSARTIANNLNKLKEYNLISEDNSYVYITPIPYLVSLDYKLLNLFISLGDNANWAKMIRIYSVLAYAWDLDVREFTRADIIHTLGLDDHDGPFIRMCLDWWRALDLIDYDVETKHSNLFGNYDYYVMRRLEKFNRKLNNTDGELTKKWTESCKVHN